MTTLRTAISAAQRLQRLRGHGARLLVRLVWHRVRRRVARWSFGAQLAAGRTARRFLASGDLVVKVEFSGQVGTSVAELAELVYRGAHPLSSEEWVELRSGRVFRPIGGTPRADPDGVDMPSPEQGFQDCIADERFKCDRKLPQDVARLTVLWFLVAADALSAAPRSGTSRQARFKRWLEDFFATARSPRHAFWACPMDAGIGATNLLLASQYFVGLAPDSAEAAGLRELRDKWCGLALRFITALDEREPTLDNNHHLLNLVSATVLGAASDDDASFERAARALVAAVPRHFGRDGVLNEGSTWYHLFVHHALRSAADFLAAVRPGHPCREALEMQVQSLAELGERVWPGCPPLLVGDADGAIYGPDVAVAPGDPEAGTQLSILRRYLAPLRPGSYASRREGRPELRCRVAAFRAQAAEEAPASAWRTWTRGRLSCRSLWLPSVPTAQDPEVRRLEDLGAIVVRRGRALVVLRTLPRTAGCPLGHFHQDVGSAYLALDGSWISLDPGVETYTGSLRRREELRSARAHPTFIPDPVQPIQPTGPFSARVQPLAERVEIGPRGVRVTHEFGGEIYVLSVRFARDGGLRVRQWTSSPGQNLPPVSVTPFNYGYRL